MKKACFLLIAYILMLAIASIPDVLCYPPAGFDYIDPTTATIELEIIGMFNETIKAEGSTNVSRSNPYDPGDGHIKIDTEIVSMNLVGTSIYIGPIVIVESPSKASTGAVQQLIPGEDYASNSSFGVFIEIQTTLGTFHNDDPVFMSTIIYGIPPWGSLYMSFLEPIPLKNEQDTTIGFIKHVSHKIGTGPIPIGGISILIEDALNPVSKFGLLDFYIGLVSVILVAVVARAICVKHVRHTNSREKP